MNQNDAHPLFVWKILLPLVILFLSFSLVFDPGELLAAKRYRTLSQGINKIKIRPDEFSLVFIGNSLILRALPEKEKKLADLVDREYKKYGASPRLKIFKFILDGGTSADIQRITEKVVSLRPSAIVLQIDIVAGRSYEFPRKGRLQAWATFYKMHLKEFIPASLKSVARNPRSRMSPAFTDFESTRRTTGKVEEDPNLSETKRLWSGQTISENVKAVPVYARLIEKASLHGTKVIIVGTPVSETVANIVGDNYFLDRKAYVASAAKQAFLLQYPELLPDDHFRDYRHVNQIGRERFLQWFIPSLTQMIAKS